MNLVRFNYGENNINTGPLKEFPEVCVDHFFGDDLNSSAFFLSHAHTDHLVGLETAEFQRRLNQPGIKLYCHPLTPILLESFNRYLGGPDEIKSLISRKKIVLLEIGHSNIIHIRRTTGNITLSVTPLSAGHCPGSIMFLFETSNFRILHTGDFRLTLDDLRSMPALHQHNNNNKTPKPINHLYVDTTFCSKSANLFPNRKTVINEAIGHLQNWISKSKYHHVHLSFSAKFAHEYILGELHKVFKQKIHVLPERLKIYENIPDVFQCVTLDNKTQLHLCGYKNCNPDAQCMTLRLSSMWICKRPDDDKPNMIWQGKNLNLCYSMHSSLEEIAQTIDYLKPIVVTPLVLPKSSDLTEVRAALQEACSTTFKFEDYRSSRNVFDGVQADGPCTIEQDQTDIVDENVQNDEDCDVQKTPGSPECSPEPIFKKRKFDDSKYTWNFKSSPSPKHNSSQSSSDNSQNVETSQEINTQEIDKETKSNHARRNIFTAGLLSKTNSSSSSSNSMSLMDQGSTSSEVNSTNCFTKSIEISYNDCNSDSSEDIMMNSQRL